MNDNVKLWWKLNRRSKVPECFDCGHFKHLIALESKSVEIHCGANQELLKHCVANSRAEDDWMKANEYPDDKMIYFTF